jgi:superfamily II DNA or RNA helicase
MSLVLYQHQKDIINKDPKKCGLFLGCGTGKTLTALHLARGKTLVVAPKTTREDNTWQRNLALMDNIHNVELLVVSKEEFRRSS